MLRFLFSVYTTGIVVFFVLFLVFVPKIPLVDAVVGALLWPWGVYRYFVQGGGVA
jgi:uncharacterized membrane protein YraQ (UPF0718 family)